MPAEPVNRKATRIDRSKTYRCRFACGYETNWPAALGRHHSARHDGHPSKRDSGRPLRSQPDASPRGPRRPLSPTARFERLLDEVRQQHGEILDALRKASLLVLAERDLRARESEQVKADLNAIYEVLERNRQVREQRISSLIR